MIQRRCLERRFLLRPGDATNQTFWYCLGVALARTGVELLCGLAMSNHYHLVVRDVRGNLPEFMHLFNMLLARSQNCRLGRWENLWSTETPSRVRLVGDDAIVRKSAYALANPVSAQLVARAYQWPGASTWQAMQTGARICARRPPHFFRAGMPEHVEIQLHAPDGMSVRDYAAQVTELVAAAERDAAAERARTRRPIIGRRAVRAQSYFASPSSHEPRREISPRVACASKWHRIEALERDRAFLEAYYDAKRLWLLGRRATFPAGTWALRQVVRIEASC
jgi:hypothetical protein